MTDPTTASAVDVAIIGAGLAGLTAARALVAKGKTVAVFEATDRVGGRTRSHQTAGGVNVDLGGTFVGPGQDHMIELAREMGCETFPTYDSGEQVMSLFGRRREYHGQGFPIALPVLLHVGTLMAAIDKLSLTVPAEAPWLAPRAAHWDALTLEEWLRGRGAGATILTMFSFVTRTSWGCEPADISFLHVLHYVRQAGGLDSLLGTTGGLQERHFLAGTAEVSERMAATLGDAVRLNSPVRSVTWGDEGVTVSTGAESVTAARLIVAIPPASRARIEFTPALPAPWADIAAQWTQGTLSKAYAVYERPFWRDGSGRGLARPLSGQAQSSAGPLCATFDASPHGEDGPGVLLGFIGGADARRWDPLPPAERRARALASFASLFGPDALYPVDFVDQRWAQEEWVTGGPTAHPGPGAWTSVGAGLATPLGPIHWAGTETAQTSTGFMDGAVRSGKRAARAVVAALKTPIDTPASSH